MQAGRPAGMSCRLRVGGGEVGQGGKVSGTVGCSAAGRASRGDRSVGGTRNGERTCTAAPDERMTHWHPATRTPASPPAPSPPALLQRSLDRVHVPVHAPYVPMLQPSEYEPVKPAGQDAVHGVPLLQATLGVAPGGTVGMSPMHLSVRRRERVQRVRCTAACAACAAWQVAGFDLLLGLWARERPGSAPVQTSARALQLHPLARARLFQVTSTDAGSRVR